MKNNTRLTRIGYRGHSEDLARYNSLNPPVYRASTVIFENYAEMKSSMQGDFGGYSYGTQGSPTQEALDNAICELEGGAFTLSLPSGLAAISHMLTAFVQSGDHVLICDSVYGPTRTFCEKVLAKFGVEMDLFPPTAGSDIEEHIRPNTKLLFLEAPGSNTFEIQDIPAVVEVAKARGILTAMDNTWATPLYFRALDHGVDISIQSATKYITGHSDVLMGTVTVNAAHAPVFRDYCRTMELFTSQDDCYLALRGLRTLPLRLKQHGESALTIARWLESKSFLKHVIHPALESHPEHHLWKRDFSGASGIFAFTVPAALGEDRIASFVDSLNLFGLGYSWGGYCSLVTAGKYLGRKYQRYGDDWLIRLNIGLEDAEDLMEDLEGALVHLK